MYSIAKINQLNIKIKVLIYKKLDVKNCLQTFCSIGYLLLLMGRGSRVLILDVYCVSHRAAE
jgi:hypothetical protein